VLIPYTIVPSDDGPDMYVPVVNVHIAKLECRERPEVFLPAILDTGATYSLFPAEVGWDIGLEIEAGRRQETILSNGQTMEFFIHTARLWIGDFVIDLEVGFGDEVGFPVLGRVGFFQRFRVSFDHSSFEILPRH